MSTKPSVAIAALPLVEPEAAEALELELELLDEADGADDEATHDILGLVRERLQVGTEVTDVTIAASVAVIAAKGDQRGRWLAAFGSPLGRWLAARGGDLNGALTTLVALSQSRAS